MSSSHLPTASPGKAQIPVQPWNNQNPRAVAKDGAPWTSLTTQDPGTICDFFSDYLCTLIIWIFDYLWYRNIPEFSFLQPERRSWKKQLFLHQGWILVCQRGSLSKAEPSPPVSRGWWPFLTFDGRSRAPLPRETGTFCLPLPASTINLPQGNYII